MTNARRTLPDANILVYSSLPDSPFHVAAVARLDEATAAGEMWTSRQVLREYLSVMTRPGTADPMPAVVDVVANVAEFLRRFRIAEDGPAVTTELLALLTTISCQGKQVHDANIVATMRAHALTHVLTHNLKDFNRFAGLITVVPLVP